MNEGKEKISSKELSERMKLTASQIRQDLNCFGGFGQQGYGYNVGVLRGEIAEIIGIEKKTDVIIIGAGNLGRAIASGMNFDERGCRLIGIFDDNPDIKNTETAGFSVMGMEDLAAFCGENSPKIAVLCIPEESAKSVCDELISLNVRSFWNFSHFDINLHYEDVTAENVHMGDSLLTLVYGVNNRQNRPANGVF
jgi:redox-sensing transcriptional repressor